MYDKLYFNKLKKDYQTDCFIQVDLISSLMTYIEIKTSFGFDFHQFFYFY